MLRPVDRSTPYRVSLSRLRAQQRYRRGGFLRTPFFCHAKNWSAAAPFTTHRPLPLPLPAKGFDTPVAVPASAAPAQAPSRTAAIGAPDAPKPFEPEGPENNFPRVGAREDPGRANPRK
jgi:hypothetical protein